MYLKTILQLEREYHPVRVKHIAETRKVSAASVTEALGTLREKSLVLHAAHGGVRLSAGGRRVAREIDTRYEVLRAFFKNVLGLDDRLAARDACEIEHVISGETLDRLTAFLKYVDHCKMGVSEVIMHFQHYFEKHVAGETCPDCDIDAGQIVSDDSRRLRPIR